MNAIGKCCVVVLLLEIGIGICQDDETYKACRKQLTYTIRNKLQAPTFEYSLQIPFCHEPFIRIMERAVNQSANYKFTATYFPQWAYFIDAINGVQGFYTVNQTWWQFLKAPSSMLPVGVSFYYPKDGDHIIFNFTQSEGH
uniref:Gastric intrinsic factor-like protein 1 n=1 Tax=Sinohyriopsis cumingii TaxID=165450 RepID=A0A0P0M6C9_SINCU|nr:gastric intrinsic factor-like protein 1 [Sinohyriopsis cumingii]